jgi:hypothetical protein
MRCLKTYCKKYRGLLRECKFCLTENRKRKSLLKLQKGNQTQLQAGNMGLRGMRNMVLATNAVDLTNNGDKHE